MSNIQGEMIKTGKNIRFSNINPQNASIAAVNPDIEQQSTYSAPTDEPLYRVDFCFTAEHGTICNWLPHEDRKRQLLPHYYLKFRKEHERCVNTMPGLCVYDKVLESDHR